MGTDAAQELLFGAEDGDVRRTLDLHRGQIERRGVGTAAVGKRHPEVTAAEHFDEPAARLRAAERGPEHLFELIGRPSALRMGLDRCRNVHCFPFSPHGLPQNSNSGAPLRADGRHRPQGLLSANVIRASIPAASRSSSTAEQQPGGRTPASVSRSSLLMALRCRAKA